MKFRFCGDGDCPDWVLAEIHSTLSTLNSVKLRMLSQIVVKGLMSEDTPEEQVREIFGVIDNNIAKSAFSCLRFLLTSAARNNTNEATFSTELQQLGLPKDHSQVLCRVLTEHFANIQTYLLRKPLIVNELEKLDFTVPKNLKNCAQFEVTIKNEIVDGIPKRTSHKINVNKCDVSVLLNELKVINNIIENYNYEKKYSETSIY